MQRALVSPCRMRSRALACVLAHWSRRHCFSRARQLLTGPNMGGKSMCARMACVAVLMAQIGCFIAARACRLSLADRLMVRMGAADRIMGPLCHSLHMHPHLPFPSPTRYSGGQSTFMVELRETSAMLRQGLRTRFRPSCRVNFPLVSFDLPELFCPATRDSFLILDELGRGTATFDGYAIAYSVLHRLASSIKPRAIFATHHLGLHRCGTT